MKRNNYIFHTHETGKIIEVFRHRDTSWHKFSLDLIEQVLYFVATFDLVFFRCGYMSIKLLVVFVLKKVSF